MKNKKTSGITLVALVITIIILLILAGIAISQLTGNGLFENAKLSKEKAKNAQDSENSILGDYENQIDMYSRGTVTLTSEEYKSITDRLTALENAQSSYIQGYMVKLNTEDVKSTSWTKMKIDENIDDYKLLEFVNDNNMGTMILSTSYFKNNYNSSSNVLDVKEYISNDNRSSHFYYNSTENAIYAKTEHSSYKASVYGIK